MSRYVIGLTGGIACGKSNVSRALAAEGIVIADADAISHELTAPGGRALPGIRECFGDDVFDGDALNRRALGEKVFAAPQALERLNRVIHPLIFEEIDRRLSEAEGIAVLEAPLLYECALEDRCDEVWCCYLPQKEQVKRLMGRDGLTRNAAMQRIKAQMSAREKAKRADFVIRTDGTAEESANKARERLNGIRKRLEEA